MPDHPLTLMLVHAHPDDESITTGGILIKYAEEGVRTVVVTCTRGELGDIQDPEHYVSPRPGMSMEEIRMAEMADALGVLKVGTFYCLDYRDSGMAGTPGNDDPRSFHQADLPEASNRLAAIIRKERPRVVVTYDETGIYFHPDHVKAHQIAQKAFFDAGNPGIKLEGDRVAFQPDRLFHIAIPMARVRRYNQETDPAARPPSSIVGTPEEEITASINIEPYLDRKFEAIFAHKSQIGGSHRFRNMSPEQRKQMLGHEHFVCAHGCGRRMEGQKETDLFAGLRG
jgi:N-acetyl-1-D-myo-inositol-2-amino-2-deoxy-alpha-D-glucopyranoside deacetylase/mycothiol S-conjugate amidase